MTERKKRTAVFRRSDALNRAVASTEAEGGTVSRVQRRMIGGYVEGSVSARAMAKKTSARIRSIP